MRQQSSRVKKSLDRSKLSTAEQMNIARRLSEISPENLKATFVLAQAFRELRRQIRQRKKSKAIKKSRRTRSP